MRGGGSMMIMYIVAIVLLVVNLLFMLFFYLKIRRNFSTERYEILMRDRMNIILTNFNFQTNQAITILEERIDEMKELLVDADKRFVALSSKMSASARQSEMLKNEVLPNEKMNEKRDGIGGLVLESQDNIEIPSLQTTTSPPVSPEIPQTTLYEDLRTLQQDPAQNDAILRMKVVEMCKSGWSIEFIADKLKRPVEEVRIIAFMANIQK